MRAGCQTIRSAAALILASAGLCLAGAARAKPQNTIIYSFKGGADGDAFNSDGLAADAAGNLYGVTREGGALSCGLGYGCGTVFRLSPPVQPGGAWTKTTLYSFLDGSDGGYPTRKLLLDVAGNIYGVASDGTTTSGVGTGTVWELSPPTVAGNAWTLSVLYTFPSGRAGLAVDGCSTQNGCNPASSLVMDRSGTLYGTTPYGGSRDLGTAFALTPPPPGGLNWTETILHSFGRSNDASKPFAPLALSAHQDQLFGTTGSDHLQKQQNCGAVYHLRKRGSTWNERVLYRFDCEPGNGSHPSGGLLVDRNNNLFGTAYAGGARNSGAVFEVSPPKPGQTAWTEQVLYSFDGLHGYSPETGVVTVPGTMALFGTALDVFRLDPPASGSGSWRFIQLTQPPIGTGLFSRRGSRSVVRECCSAAP